MIVEDVWLFFNFSLIVNDALSDANVEFLYALYEQV